MLNLFKKDKKISNEFSGFVERKQIEEIYKVVWFDGVEVRKAHKGEDKIMYIQTRCVYTPSYGLAQSSVVLYLDDGTKIYLNDVKEIYTREVNQ